MQRYYFISKYAIFLQKIRFFSLKICSIQKNAVPLHPISAIAHVFEQFLRQADSDEGAIVYRLGQEIFIL